MHALLVVSHPVHTSLTHSVATAIAQGSLGQTQKIRLKSQILHRKALTRCFLCQI